MDYGRRRKDLQEGTDRPYHPDRGHLRGGKYTHRVAKRMLKKEGYQGTPSEVKYSKDLKVKEALATAEALENHRIANARQQNQSAARAMTVHEGAF